ncbi:hypothetical protein [Bradyrhizobium sp.]|uniref:hypothetical protein n=1 Tax=Bradyrhizobium sp. TaxID=376 RepID=UPI00261DE646|nr:hypothetical protein [Bradyrhizobium sp.]
MMRASRDAGIELGGNIRKNGDGSPQAHFIIRITLGPRRRDFQQSMRGNNRRCRMRDTCIGTNSPYSDGKACGAVWADSDRSRGAAGRRRRERQRAGDCCCDPLPEATVKTHLQHLFQKAGSRRPIDLVKLVLTMAQRSVE